MSRESILKKKSFDFAVRVIKLSNYLRKEHRAHELAGQILRSGTSVGAIVREAEHAESKKDFIHKLNIGLKEINESVYWLELLYATCLINQNMYESLITDATELLKMLVASIKTMKNKMMDTQKEILPNK